MPTFTIWIFRLPRVKVSPATNEDPSRNNPLAYDPAAVLPPVLTRQGLSKYDSRSTPQLQQINQEY